MVACKASMQQGSALARVLEHWRNASERDKALTRGPRKGHLATMFGLAGAVLDLPVEAVLRSFVHCSVRDMVSAAVRLNLIGPLRGVELQAQVLRELEGGILAL